MSFESILKNLTEALDRNTAAHSGTNAAAPAAKPAAKQMEAAPATTAATPVPPTTKTPAATPTPAPPAPAKGAMTADDLNDLIKKEFVRIGNQRDPITALFTKYGASGTYSLDPGHFDAVIAELAAIPSV